ncbi:MAG: ribulose-phosphate 3-epimerase [Bacilli bacterium]
MKISASFLSSNQISKDLEKLNVTDVDYIHVDVMDGKFVNNKSLAIKELKNIYKYTSKRLDVHLMVIDPIKAIKEFAKLNTEYITFHVELEKDILSLISLVHKYGIKCGLAISPNTDIEMIFPYLEQLDLVVLMSVVPGESGQEFILETTVKLAKLKEKIEENNLDIKIMIDGGINLETKDYVKEADILVSGSCILKSDNYQEVITDLRK